MEIQKPKLDVLLAEHAQLELPISPEEDILIRKMDLFGKADDLTEQEEQQLALNLDRFLRLHRTHKEKTHNPAPSKPLEANPQEGLAKDYFQSILNSAGPNEISFHCMCLGSPLKDPSKRSPIMDEAFRIARDAIIVLGEDQYDAAMKKIVKAYAREIDPEYILLELPSAAAEFYRDSMQGNFWSQAPVGWARDCFLLAQHPHLLKAIIELPKRTAKSQKRDVPGYAQQFAERAVKGPLPRYVQKEQEQERQKREARAIDNPPLELIHRHRKIIQILKKAMGEQEKNPLNRYTKLTYTPVSHPNHTSRKGPIQRFLMEIYNQIPQEEIDKQLQYRVAECAETVARHIKAQRKAKSHPDTHNNLPTNKDLNHVIAAAQKFRHLALLRNPFRREASGRSYILKPDLSSPDKWTLNIIENEKLVHSHSNSDSLELSNGISPTDYRMIHELLDERDQKEDDIIQNFTIEPPKDGQKNRIKESTEALHTLYVLTHFLCRVTQEHIKKATSIKTIRTSTQNQVHQATK